jgi:peroxiredoxin
MAENSVSQSAQPRRPFWRSVLLPIVVIGAIAFAIWWIDYRDSGGSSPSGEHYGSTDLPSDLRTLAARVGPQEGEAAPDFLLPALDGPDVRLSDLRGKAVIVNFWATWCAPCRRELPQFVAAYDRYKGQGLVILGVNVQENRDTVRAEAQDFGIDYPLPIDADGSVVDSYKLLGLPTTYFIDRQGIVRSVYRGPFVQSSNNNDVLDAIGAGDLSARIREILG